MELKYLYPFNQERYKFIVNNEIKYVDKLSSEIVNCGYILPARNNNENLFGLGGVVDSKFNYIKESGITSRGRYLEGENRKYITSFGGVYEFKDYKYIDEEVVYLGLITNHWGHFLVDFSTRLWYALACNKNQKYAFVVKEDQNFQLINNIKRFFELLGLPLNNIIFINQVTKFRKIIIPQVSYRTNDYYSSEFLKVFDVVASNVDYNINDKIEEGNKIYFTRQGYYKAKSSEVGEEILVNLFDRNGFDIVSPEKYSLDEQIRIIRNSSIIAAVTGTIPHNMLFAKKKQKLLIINKTYNLNMMQKDINFMKQLDVNYIDSYVSIFPVSLGEGPFAIVYNENLHKYIKDMNMIYPEKKYMSEKHNITILYKFMRLVRQSYSKNSAINYVSDSNNSAYFNPEHLTLFYTKYYFLLNPIKLKEVWYQKVNIYKKNFGKVKERIIQRFK